MVWVYKATYMLSLRRHGNCDNIREPIAREKIIRLVVHAQLPKLWPCTCWNNCWSRSDWGTRNPYEIGFLYHSVITVDCCCCCHLFVRVPILTSRYSTHQPTDVNRNVQSDVPSACQLLSWFGSHPGTALAGRQLDNKADETRRQVVVMQTSWQESGDIQDIKTWRGQVFLAARVVCVLTCMHMTLCSQSQVVLTDVQYSKQFLIVWIIIAPCKYSSAQFSVSGEWYMLSCAGELLQY